MANNYLTGYGDIPTLDIEEEDSSVENDTTVNDILYNLDKISNNNYPLCRFHPETCTIDDMNSDDNIVDENTISTEPLITRSTRVTFESIYQNMSSYSYDLDVTDKKYIIKKYKLDVDKSITIITDMRTPKLVITTISGDTGYDKKLVKRIDMSTSKYDIKYYMED